MSLVLGDNFSYQGAKPLDARLKYDMLAQMKAMADSVLYDGCLAFCKEDSKTYQWISTNEVDATTGRWREFKSGSDGGGIIDISSKSNNAIKNITGSTISSEDGLYVEDLKTEINKLNYAQKTVNSELDYAACWYYNTNGLTANVNDILKYDGKNTNIDIDITTGKINLKGGKKYFIGMNLRTRQGSCFYGLYNSSNNLLCYGFKNSSASTTSKWSDKELNYVITPKVDTQYFIKIDESYDSCLISSYELYIAEIGREVTIDPVEYVDSTKGIEDTPVGHVISIMSNKAPAHYLICDGSEYNIIDYPYLADHFKTEFGSINYFGGDGITTFAVPDLRGEFLRGTGTNSHANQGSGAAVGEHQDATEELDTAYSTKYNYKQMVGIRSEAEYETAKNVDSYIANANSGYLNEKLDTLAPNPNNKVAYTARPTNTSVLYVIKAEPTYYMELNQDAYVNEYCDYYDTNERIVGRWTDGRPVYRKVVSLGDLTANTKEEYIPTEISNVDHIVDFNIRYKFDDGNEFDNLYLLQYSLGYITPYIDNASKKIYVAHYCKANLHSVYSILEYTKTTDAPNSFDYGMIMDQFAQEALVDVAVTDAEVDKCFE